MSCDNLHRYIFILGVIFLFLLSPQAMANDGRANSDASDLAKSSCDSCKALENGDAVGLSEDMGTSLTEDAATMAQYLADPMNVPDVAVPSSRPR